jgi:hypothetical protein
MSILPDVIAADTAAARPVLRDPRAVGMFVFGVAVGAVSMAPEYSRARTSDPPLAAHPQTAPVHGDISLSPSPADRTLLVTDTPRASARARAAGHRGTLVVRSTPAGAAVFINNRPAGKTPLVMRSMPVGSRAVRVTLNGHATWSRGVQVVADQSTTVVARLDPQ